MNVFIESLWAGYGASIARGFDFLGPAGTIRTSDRIAIKPNLTFPTYRPGVMASLDALTALVTYLKNFTDKITICESDSGGYNPFSMDEVFRNTGITEFANRMGVRIVNMSHSPSRLIRFRRHLPTISVPLPTLLLDETDRFITMPVPKVHLNTNVSAEKSVASDPGTRAAIEATSVLQRRHLSGQQDAPKDNRGRGWEIRIDSQRSNAG
jgi:uncharacterized protein (DUF362 family)